MNYIPNILFVLILVVGIGYFTKNIRKVIRSIRLGKPIDHDGNKGARFLQMAKIALGQSKMVRRPVSGVLHIVVYLGFIIINIEVLEIIIDGIFGTHRIFSFLGSGYNFLIGTFEIFALLVFIGVVIFWIRRNVIRIQRFMSAEMKGWPKMDGNLILYFEMVLMFLFIVMNAADFKLQLLEVPHYFNKAGVMGSFPISQFVKPMFDNMEVGNIILIERATWWMHIIGILIFLNYLYFSKHLHILLAFPNTYFGSLRPKGTLNNLAAVTKEVQLMMDPDADPFAAPAAAGEEDEEPAKFGASDVMDLDQLQLLNAYTCTECGRCTSECPASQTGKKLSPRKIMMDVRDRLQEVGANLDKNKGQFVDDKKQLLNDYISPEELWACTSCNACVEACPVSISPLSIIMDMRRYLVMEQSAAPGDLNTMMSNIENNGAPWPFNQMDRLQWKDEA